MQNIHIEDQSSVRDIVKNSASSFYWGMNILENNKKRAMFAIYAFCRIVDDIADSELKLSQKKHLLMGWRKKISKIYEGVTTDYITRELLFAVNLFRLKKIDFFDIIRGMIKDTEKKIIYPSLKELEKYCDQVAGAVGCLSVNVFGIHNQKIAREYAIFLGRALQCTNILRDLWEDNQRGRCYINREIIVSEGLQNVRPKELLECKKFVFVYEKFFKQTKNYYIKAENIAKTIDQNKILAAEIMKSLYSELLKKMTVNDIRNKKRVKINPLIKFFLVLKELMRKKN